MAIWRDAWGEEIHPGDIVEDLNRRVIGEVKFMYGKPHIHYFKQFSAQTLGYEFVDVCAPDEAYVRCLAPKKEWRYRLNGHRLNNVELLQKLAVKDGHAQTVTPIDMPPWDAPVPIEWRTL